jgi:hypothetical protein
MSLQFTRRQALTVGLGSITGAAIRIRANAQTDDDSPGGDAYAPWRNWRGAPGAGPRAPVNATILGSRRPAS